MVNMKYQYPMYIIKLSETIHYSSTFGLNLVTVNYSHFYIEPLFVTNLFTTCSKNTNCNYWILSGGLFHL